jgi:hypothetical protein
MLSFIIPPDFDASFFHSFSLAVSASDGVNFPTSQFITVNVTNVDDMPPIISSNGAGETAAISISENTTAVTTVTAIDLEPGATLTYSMSGGADAALFQIDKSTGALSFKAAPGFRASVRCRS